MIDDSRSCAGSYDQHCADLFAADLTEGAHYNCPVNYRNSKTRDRSKIDLRSCAGSEA